MTVLRRTLGIFVMIAGVIGLILSLTGMVGMLAARPALIASLDSTINTLSSSIDTSQKVLTVTHEALGATVLSVNALSDMLGTTAVTVEETQPVITQVNDVMGVTIPTSLEVANDSLKAAELAAESLEGAIISFQGILKSVPFLSAFIPKSQQDYNPDKPLAESLGELAMTIEEMPGTFEGISANLGKADGNLELIRDNLDTMSTSTSQISDSLSQYQTMIGESKASMDALKTMLDGTRANLGRAINILTLVFGFFFLWLLAAQIVIFSQGWELFHGTANQMATIKVEESLPEPEAEEVKQVNPEDAPTA